MTRTASNTQTEIGEKVLAELSEMGVPPSPQIYETWFRYRNDEIAPLSYEIEKATSRGEKITAGALKDLYKKFCATQKLNESLALILKNIGIQTSSIQALLKDFSFSAAEFSQGAHDAETHLRNLSDDSDRLQSVIQALIVNTQTATMRNSQLEEKLDAATHEIFSLQQELKKIEQDSLKDALTQVSNRRHYDICLHEEIANAHNSNAPLCLIMCDIDHFKKFNDRWGHDVGDQVLKAVAQILVENTKGKDVVARYGGEEFALILPETAADDARALAEKIRAFVNRRKLRSQKQDHDLGVLTMSFGVTEYAKDFSADEFFATADQALYEAKKGGRNKVIFRAMSHAKGAAVQ